MTTEEMVEAFIEEGVRCYKKVYRNTEMGRRLDKHLDTYIHNVEISCWRELSTLKMAEYIQEICPNASVKVELDGNNTTITLSINNEDQQKINAKMYTFLKKIKCA